MSTTPNPNDVPEDIAAVEKVAAQSRAVNTTLFNDAMAMMAELSAAQAQIVSLQNQVNELESELSGVAPAFTADTPPGGTVGTPYAYTITASGTPAPSITVSGEPAGLTFDGAHLAGTPTTTGSFTLTITATNTAGTVSASPVVVIAPSSTPLSAPVFPAVPTPETLPSGLAHTNNTGSVSGYQSVVTKGYTQYMSIFAKGAPVVLAVNGQPQNPYDSEHATNATTWQCKDVYGNRSTGTITAGSETFSPTPPVGSAFPCGWYNITLWDGTQQISDGQILVWNDNVPNLPTLSSLPNTAPAYLGGTSTTPTISSPYDGPHWPLAASTGNIGQRMAINDVTNPENGIQSADWADTQVGDLAYLAQDASWFTKYQTPQRPHQNICEFPNGTAQPIDCPGQEAAGSIGTDQTGLGVLVQQTEACTIASPSAGTVTVTAGATTETWTGATWGALSAAINAGSKLIYSWTDEPGGTATTFAPIAVPSAYFAGVVSQVEALMAAPNPPIFEGPYNEPLQSAASTIAQTVCFIKAVHQGGGKAMGPMPVTFNGAMIGWLETVLAGLKTAGTMVDAISVHGYNTVNGDLILGDHCLSGLTTMLNGLGLSHVPVWMTETGEFVNNFGSLNWRSSTHWTALRTLMYEAYGIPMERQCYYYLQSHGFDGFPSYLIGQGVRPAPQWCFFRGLIERTSDATFTERLVMPGPAQRMLFGSVYNSAEATTVVLMTAGLASAVVNLNIGSAASVVYDWAGNVTGTHPGGAGLSVLASDLPTYVVLPAGTTVTVTDVDNGLAECTADLALTATVHSSSTSAEYGTVGQVNNGIWEDGAYYGNGSPGGNDPTRPFRDAVAPPAWVGLEWATPQSVKRVVLTAPVPWQTQTAPLSFTVSTWNGSAWIAQYGYTNPNSASNPFPSGNPAWKASQENYWDSTSTWDIVLPEAVETEAVLVTVTATSWGDAPDQNAATASYNYQWPPALCLREVEVYDD